MSNGPGGRLPPIAFSVIGFMAAFLKNKASKRIPDLGRPAAGRRRK
jgi:hypothetical protein